MNKVNHSERPVIGKYPDRLYKAFDSQEHRDSFLSGCFWMGGIKKYISIESEGRRDNSEGTAVYKYPDLVQTMHISKDSEDTYVTEAPGLMQTTSTLGNPMYLLCAAQTTVDIGHLKRQFGIYLAEITSPINLAMDILSFYENSEHNIIGGIEGTEVVYNKGGVVESQLKIHESSRLSYIQKPAKFKDDHEFRFIVKFGGTEKQSDHIVVELGKRLPYANPV